MNSLPEDLKTLDYGLAARLVMVGSGVFFTVLFGLARTFPGRTSPTGLRFALATFAFFAGLSVLSLVLMARSRVRWNTRTVEGADTWGRRRRLTWDELEAVEYVVWAGALRLRAPGGRHLWVSPMMQGFAEFLEEARRQCLAREWPAPL